MEKQQDDNTIRKSWYKQLLLDIEDRNIDVRLVTLDYLSSLSSLFYGTKHTKNEEVKDKRRRLSLKLSDLTRLCNRSPTAYLSVLKRYKVTPSPTTLALVQLEEEGKDFSIASTKKRDSLLPTEAEKLSEDLKELTLDPTEVVVPSPPTFSSPQITFSPPPVARKMSALTPPRTIVTGDETVAGMTHSSGVSLSLSSDKPKGSEQNPEIFFFTEDSQGHYTNGYNVYQPPEMISKNVSYKGICAFRKVDPSDIMDHSAILPSRDYLLGLAARNILSEEHAYMPAILFKKPMVEAGDRVGPKALVKIQFPCKESKQQVSKLQAKTKPTDAYYTLGVFDLGDYVFDNRIFSENDRTIDGHESVPPAVPVVGNEKTMHWHIIWRIAFKETGEALEGEASMSIEEIIKKRRNEKTF